MRGISWTWREPGDRKDGLYTSPCDNRACCGKSGFCGYSSTYCGTSGTSPNDLSWNNCDAHAECGKDLVSGNRTLWFLWSWLPKWVQYTRLGATNSSTQNRIIGYYESSANRKQCMGININQIPIENLTHLNYAFGYITPGTYEIGAMSGVDASTFFDFIALKSKNSDLKAGLHGPGTAAQPIVFSDEPSPLSRSINLNSLGVGNPSSMKALLICWYSLVALPPPRDIIQQDDVARLKAKRAGGEMEEDPAVTTCVGRVVVSSTRAREALEGADGTDATAATRKTTLKAKPTVVRKPAS
ncbi:hypothetical protein TSTA_082080 [Talaromyces stipitatus ATCC 10500]|uniref:Chitin-binding type-1 domain-containing protein n=1 Tax=Talaromyces stipitatus (strain ATCC 10500 / CBS 375.48 / QM 6759 / NRRL 1006) TaxID=441959 RepID=B8M133_TALSN|nr:uncharacterized protein TSTA_082080 [Talaromyces stipitatus ATCC 10500]EED20975.1 hypothetical protein TSTA_082080 [Talaromyces stipitatus ATCC 10500]